MTQQIVVLSYNDDVIKDFNPGSVKGKCVVVCVSLKGSF